MVLAHWPQSAQIQYEAIQGMICLSQEELEREIALGHISDGFTLSAYALYRAMGIPDQCRPRSSPEVSF